MMPRHLENLVLEHMAPGLRGYQINVNLRLSRIITTGLFPMVCFHLGEHEYNY